MADKEILMPAGRTTSESEENPYRPEAHQLYRQSLNAEMEQTAEEANKYRERFAGTARRAINISPEELGLVKSTTSTAPLSTPPSTPARRREVVGSFFRSPVAGEAQGAPAFKDKEFERVMREAPHAAGLLTPYDPSKFRGELFSEKYSAPRSALLTPARYIKGDAPGMIDSPERHRLKSMAIDIGEEEGIEDLGEGWSDIWRNQIRAESRWDPNATSSAGARGLVQFMPKTWEDMVKKHGIRGTPLDPEQNLRASVRYLKDISKRLKTRNPAAILAAYNWGPRNVMRKGLNRLPKETSNYLQKILGDNWRDYVKAYEAERG